MKVNLARIAHDGALNQSAGPDLHEALSPVGRESLQERVYTMLRRSLIHGAFDAGQVLRMQELADQLQTSTMPVREALARLVSEQALETTPSRSVRVPLITRARLEDLLDARCLIEGHLVALALPNLKTSDFARLRELSLACEAAFALDDAVKGQTTSELNHAFHFHVYDAARSAVLIPIVESLWLQSGPYTRAAAEMHRESRDGPAVHFHWSLIDALHRRDGDAAVKALACDIGFSFDLIRAGLGADGKWDGQAADV